VLDEARGDIRPILNSVLQGRKNSRGVSSYFPILVHTRQYPSTTPFRKPMRPWDEPAAQPFGAPILLVVASPVPEYSTASAQTTCAARAGMVISGHSHMTGFA